MPIPSLRVPGIPLFAGALCLVLLGSGASSVRADEAGAGPILAARDFELLPINDLEKSELVRDHEDLARRVGVLTKRAARLRVLLARRARFDDGARKLSTQIEQLETELAPLMAEVVRATRDLGVDDVLLAHIAKAPRGARRTARYAAGLVLHVDGIPPGTRAIFERLLPRYEGALIALDAQRERLRAYVEGTKDEQGKERPEARAALLAVDRQLKGVENRYWRLVDYVVPEAARAAVHRRLPTAYQRRENVLQYIYAAPQLKPAQGVRLRGLIQEIEAGSAPDNAAVKRLTAALRGGAAAAQKAELVAAQHRLIELQRFAVTQAKQIYTAAQWVWLEAIPPRVPIGDRRQTSPQVLAGVALSAAQRERLSTMRKSLSGVREAFLTKRRTARAKAAQYGPDSPQMAGMQMEMAAIQADGNALQREFNGRLFLELLTPEQIDAWVLAPAGRT